MLGKTNVELAWLMLPQVQWVPRWALTEVTAGGVLCEPVALVADPAGRSALLGSYDVCHSSHAVGVAFSSEGG